MLPKVQAATAFLRSGGRRVVITSMETIEDAVAGRVGTEVTRE
jgi:carbamate kinase